MNDLSFLKKYIGSSIDDPNDLVDENHKHQFFQVNPEEIADVTIALGNLPQELENFYKNIGFGTFHCANTSFNYNLFNPEDLKIINLKLGDYALDPDLEVYDCFSIDHRLLFFNVIDGIYLFIDKQSRDDKNAIYYFDQQIFQSLSDFIVALDENSELLSEISNNY